MGSLAWPCTSIAFVRWAVDHRASAFHATDAPDDVECGPSVLSRCTERSSVLSVHCQLSIKVLSSTRRTASLRLSSPARDGLYT